MANHRWVNTRIWNDSWVSQLDHIEKLLFIYFLTNQHTNLSGIYELPLKIAAVETGIDVSMFAKILPRMAPKVYFEEGWVIIVNFPKHQTSENPKIMAGFQRELALVPENVYNLSIGYGYPIHRQSHLTLLNSTLLPAKAVSSFQVVPDTDVDKPAKEEKKVLEGYLSMVKWAEQRRGFPFLAKAKQYKALRVARENKIKSIRLKERWIEFEEQEFWKDKGFDWMDVVMSFSKRV